MGVGVDEAPRPERKTVAPMVRRTRCTRHEDRSAGVRAGFPKKRNFLSGGVGINLTSGVVLIPYYHTDIFPFFLLCVLVSISLFAVR